MEKKKIPLKKVEEVRLRIGEDKDLSRNRTISFTRANPTQTYNATKKHLEKSGIEYEHNEARTGSRYISFYIDGVPVEIRFSNHTKGYDRRYEQEYMDSNIGISDGKVSRVDIDLANNDYGIDYIKEMIAEVKDFNANQTLAVDEMVKKSVLPSNDKTFEKYNILKGYLDKEVLWNFKSNLYKSNIQEKEKFDLGEYTYTASNGVKIIHDAGISLDVPNDFQGDKAARKAARKAAVNEYLNSEEYADRESRYKKYREYVESENKKYLDVLNTSFESDEDTQKHSSFSVTKIIQDFENPKLAEKRHIKIPSKISGTVLSQAQRTNLANGDTIQLEVIHKGVKQNVNVRMDETYKVNITPVKTIKNNKSLNI